MSARVVPGTPTLDELRADPARFAWLSPEQARLVAAELVILWTAAMARAMSGSAPASSPTPGPEPACDGNVTLSEAVTLSGKSRRWFYDHWRKLEKQGIAFRLGRDIMFRRAKFERWRKGLTP